MIDIKPLKFIHGSFCFSIFLFAAVVCYMNKDLMFFNLYLSHPILTIKILSYSALIFALLGRNWGAYFFKDLIGKIEDSSTINEKFTKYQTAFLIKCVILEAAAIFSIVMFLITYNAYLIVIAAFPFIALLLMRPTKVKVFTVLQIEDTNLY